MEILDSLRNQKTYNGNTYKFGIRLEDKDYLVKYPKSDDLSVFCEYLASGIISRMGFPCQTVVLGTYHGVVVDVIEDFTSGTNQMLHSFRDIKQAGEDTDIGDKEYTYEDATYLIRKHLKLRSEEKDAALHQFWQMFLCDAILANRDRHWGNWGYLSSGNHYQAAPIYDNGACLFPNVNRVIEEFSLHPINFLKEQIYTFPASLFMINTDKKRHPERSRADRPTYYEILENSQMGLAVDPVLCEEWQLLLSRHSLSSMYEITTEMVGSLGDYVSQPVKHFWTSIVPLRFACLIERRDFEDAYEELRKRRGEGGYA